MDKSISLAELAQAIRSRRGELSLSKVAEETGVSASTLSRIERGQTPDIKSVEKLATWLGLEIRTSETQSVEIPSSDDVRRMVEVHLRGARKLSSDVARNVANTVEMIMEWEINKHQTSSSSSQQ